MSTNTEKKERISLVRKIDIFAIGAIIAWGVMVFFLWAGIAHGQTGAASQPASQPVVVAAAASAGGKAWLLANLWWLVPLAINVLSSVATALKNYPKADGVAKVLWIIVAMLGNVEFKDGKKPGLAFKPPFTAPALPPPSAANVAAPAADAAKPSDPEKKG
jgi:hypothetical protein